MSPETRAALDALPAEQREAILTHLAQQRRRPRQGDSSAGLPGWLEDWPDDYQTRSTSDFR
jgi:hypothetical protein